MAKESTLIVTKTSRFITLGMALLFAICLVSSGRANEPSFTTINVPGAFYTNPSGINTQGDIVGGYGGFGHGFLPEQGRVRHH